MEGNWFVILQLACKGVWCFRNLFILLLLLHLLFVFWQEQKYLCVLEPGGLRGTLSKSLCGHVGDGSRGCSEGPVAVVSKHQFIQHMETGDTRGF